MSRKIWGVDSASKVTEDSYQCVYRNFGWPAYWGRYLTSIPNVSDGLSKEELALLRSKGIKVLPIFNDFKEATSYSNGKIVAGNAIFHARKLGFREGTAIFANVENFFKVDAEWIRGWVERFYNSGYRPGFYHDPVEGQFSDAYCKAAQNSKLVSEQSILWSAEPEPGASKKNKAPKFNPSSPPCKSNVWAWQYGRDAKECPIDTNLIDERLLKYLP